ncbi:MAG: hypothetical protein U0235_02365 [Polyangiaceae bacterium]
MSDVRIAPTARELRFAIVTLTLLSVACNGQVATEESTGRAESTYAAYGLRDNDAGHAPSAERRPNRVRSHGGAVLASPNIALVYLGMSAEIGVAPSRDDLISWTLGSGDAYWGILAQYGVGAGRVVGSYHVPRAAVLTSAVLAHGPIVPVADLEASIRAFLHPTSGVAPLPRADAYVFMLPDGINVSFGQRGSKVYTSCIDVGAYHRFDGDEPYTVIPPCELGRSARAISHELAEMSTDPIVGTGWLSDSDANLGIGEIADLCNREVTTPIAGFAVTQLWSNRDSDCRPKP